MGKWTTNTWNWKRWAGAKASTWSSRTTRSARTAGTAATVPPKGRRWDCQCGVRGNWPNDAGKPAPWRGDLAGAAERSRRPRAATPRRTEGPRPLQLLRARASSSGSRGSRGDESDSRSGTMEGASTDVLSEDAAGKCTEVRTVENENATEDEQAEREGDLAQAHSRSAGAKAGQPFAQVGRGRCIEQQCSTAQTTLDGARQWTRQRRPGSAEEDDPEGKGSHGQAGRQRVRGRMLGEQVQG